LNSTKREDNTNHLIELLGSAFPSDAARLVRLPDDRPIVYVGDIHGDLDAVDTVFSRYPSPDHVLVFLGDIVDRGPHSADSLARIAEEKIKTPSSIHLLMGNHEARSICHFKPADFWDALRNDQSERLSHHLEKLPLAAWHSAGILATHGGLPNLPSLDRINSISLGDSAWRAITWGDWVDKDTQMSGEGVKRPSFGPTAFAKRMAQLGVSIHIRSHQPTCPLYSFSDHCLTLFTTSEYGDGKRRIALLSPSHPIDSARDLELIEI